MMKSQEYANAIVKNEQQITVLQRHERRLRTEWLKEQCPLKVGDIVPCNSYSFEGKKLKIESVNITDRMCHSVSWDCRWKWIATGPVLKKDGTPGLNYSVYAVAIEGVIWKDEV
jgi:hypothetical protein